MRQLARFLAMSTCFTMSHVHGAFPQTKDPYSMMDIKWRNLPNKEEEVITRIFSGAPKDDLKAHLSHVGTGHHKVFTWKIDVSFLDEKVRNAVTKCNEAEGRRLEETEFDAHLSPTAPLSLPAAVFRASRIQPFVTKMTYFYPLFKSCPQLTSIMDRSGLLYLLANGGFAYATIANEIVGMSALMLYSQSGAKEDTSLGLWFGAPQVVTGDHMQVWKEHCGGTERMVGPVHYDSKKAELSSWGFVKPHEVFNSRYGGFIYEFTDAAQWHGKPMEEELGSKFLFIPMGLDETIGAFPDLLGPFSLVKTQLHVNDALMAGVPQSSVKKDNEKYFTQIQETGRDASILFDRSSFDVRVQVLIDRQWGPTGLELKMPMLITQERPTMYDGTEIASEYGMFDGHAERHLMTVFVYPASDSDTANGNLVPGNWETFYNVGDDNLKQYVGLSDGGLIFVGVKPRVAKGGDVAAPVDKKCFGYFVDGSCQFHFMALVPSSTGGFRFERPIPWKFAEGVERIPSHRFHPVTDPMRRAAGAKSYAWIYRSDDVRRVPVGMAFRFIDDRKNVVFKLKGGSLWHRFLETAFGGFVFMLIASSSLCAFGLLMDAWVQKRVGKVPLWMDKWSPRFTRAWKVYFRKDFAGQDDDEQLEMAGGVLPSGSLAARHQPSATE